MKRHISLPSLPPSRSNTRRSFARELGARYLVEGSLRRTGNRARVGARLIETETGKYLWAERYDSDIGDILAVQDEVAQRVSGGHEIGRRGAEGGI